MLDKEIETDYKNRINRVFEFIDKNLESDLSLNTVSEIAFFSPFHFHRVFKFVTGETLNGYITRRRIEKSASDLLHKNITATEIAHKYGFSDNSSYSRTFKKYFGVNPTEFKKQNPNRHSKIRQLESKNGQEYPIYEKYICIIDNLKKWTEMNAKIEVKVTPELNLAGVTHVGVNGIENAFEKLTKWAIPKGLLKNPEAKMGRVFFDSFKFTAPDKVRMSIFLVTNESFETEGEINKLTISKGKCIIGRFEITPMEFEKSWTSLFIWMNENGYKKGIENPYEIYHNDYREHPENKFIVDLYIPIE
ncbi:AraC family transcriptional regulator [Algibacter amylolyticus]|uniref:AraC family transcriptional regulator n=1 Tax=Algibacter amylolyticus TaxID=1608400 RepID=A0A5M7AS24_9FLAO|nr:AraC family transcriptional regulator [Algibacter amylolyticus]TSJ70489.1 AraC family transcriptional regulator [Algibacter amylolyticus]